MARSAVRRMIARAREGVADVVGGVEESAPVVAAVLDTAAAVAEKPLTRSDVASIVAQAIADALASKAPAKKKAAKKKAPRRAVGDKRKAGVR